MRAMHVVAGLALRGSKMFMQRRPLDRLRPGLWEHPGGKVEDGEEEPEALAREWAEELAWRNDVGVDLPVSIDVGQLLATVAFEIEVPITLDLYEVDLRRDLTLQTLNAKLVSREGCQVNWIDAGEAIQHYALSPGSYLFYPAIRDRIEGRDPDPFRASAKASKPDQKRIDMGGYDRAAGAALCAVCGFELYDHPTVDGYRWLHRRCDGGLVKL